MGYKSFNQIINSVSPDEMQNPDICDNRQKNIAVFARLIANGHPGWDSFSKDIKNKFYQEIENLYNQDKPSDENLLKQMETVLVRCIPDNHSFILTPDRQKALTTDETRAINDKIIDKCPQTNVGSNTAHVLPDSPGFKTLCRQGPDDFPLTICETTDRSGKPAGIISLTKCPQPSDKNYDLELLKKTFADNYNHWDAVVIDVRGNEGGNAEILNFMTEKLYGTAPRYYQRQEMRTTPEAKIFQEQKYNRVFLDQLHAQNPNGYQTPQFTEPDFSPDKGYNKNIYVLADRKTGSSAEFVSGLRKHPKVKYLGENTCGCGQYGDTAQVRLPGGGYLNMGIYKNELFAGIKEGEGMSPTHPTAPGRDAFDHCRQMMKYDFAKQRVTAYLPEHTPVTKPSPASVDLKKIHHLKSLREQHQN